MAFRGLFIGLDRYASPNVPWLNCAKRDATALHALFTDSLGGNSKLLTDAQATRSALKEELEELTNCAEDDLVVITFSGHGTETHELVTFDAALEDLPRTCIPLDELADWFSKIPARHLVLVLDCCFSGGIGSKVLQVPMRPRNLASASALLDQLSGEGRLILTASSANEEAWENAKIGHGLLTHFLIQALQGAPEVQESGRVSVFRLLDYVTKRVADSASELGAPQHPTLRGRLDGNVYWPILTAGELYFSAFPNRQRTPASREVHSLESFGFAAEVLDAWSRSIPTLNNLQLRAINEFGVLDGEHLLVSAPTSSGKTMIGELAALLGVCNRRRSLFLMPLKALVNDKQRQFEQTYGAFGVRTIQATGETALDDIAALMHGQYDICLMTYEKFTALALGHPHLLAQVGTIVVDEVQMIADPSRGVNLEFLLTLIRMRRRQGLEPQVIALSAVIGNTNGFERWIGGRLLLEKERPVPLDEGLILGNGSFRYVSSDSGDEQTTPRYIAPERRKGTSQDVVIPLVRKLVLEGKQVIVFRETKGAARGCANYLYNDLNLPSADEALRRLPTGDPSQASAVLRQTLTRGVAFHISDLDRDERIVVEEEFRKKDSKIRVIAATTTLAMGVNTPAEAVVIAGLTHPGDTPYSVAEYKNIVGRAGRLGYAQRGLSFLVALTPSEEHSLWRQYVKGEPEDLDSRFLSADTDPRSLILRVLAAASDLSSPGMSGAEVADFLEASFGVFRATQTAGRYTWDQTRIQAAIKELEGHKMISETDQGAYQLTELGRLAGEGGVEVTSMIRVIGALDGLTANQVTDPTLIALCQLTAELDEVYYPINKKSTQKEPAEWFGQLARQGVAPRVQNALRNSPGVHPQQILRAKKAVACLLWISDLPMQVIEKLMTQFGGAFEAAGPTRSAASRTADLLPTVARIGEILVPGLDLSDRRAKLVARLECGASHHHGDLSLELGTRLSRADYQNLTKAQLTSIGSISSASDSALDEALRSNSGKRKLIREAISRLTLRKEQAVVEIPEIPVYQD